MARSFQDLDALRPGELASALLTQATSFESDIAEMRRGIAEVWGLTTRVNDLKGRRYALLDATTRADLHRWARTVGRLLSKRRRHLDVADALTRTETTGLAGLVSAILTNKAGPP